MNDVEYKPPAGRSVMPSQDELERLKERVRWLEEGLRAVVAGVGTPLALRSVAAHYLGGIG